MYSIKQNTTLWCDNIKKKQNLSFSKPNLLKVAIATICNGVIEAQHSYAAREMVVETPVLDAFS